MRLIDADVLEEQFGISDEDIIAKEIIENAPTIDADPVRHGHWIWYKNHWECSVCRNNRFTNDSVLGLNAAYCSYCGAKMDGDKR